jgi:hypothetical protein
MRLAGLVALIPVAPCSAQSNLWTQVGSHSWTLWSNSANVSGVALARVSSARTPSKATSAASSVSPFLNANVLPP